LATHRRPALGGGTNAIARGKTVLEIGVGTGLLSLCALEQNAARVVGTDINPAAAACARYNAARFGHGDRFDCRLVTKTNAGAFAVIRPDEKFDLIISNPPWVDRRPKSDFEYALYDPGFELLKTLLQGLHRHLNPGGRVFLAYGSVSGIQTLRNLAGRLGYEVRTVDDTRRLTDLPEEFLPGMTLEVIVPPEKLRDPPSP
jgi:release factor glutamine methyltransferase